MLPSNETKIEKLEKAGTFWVGTPLENSPRKVALVSQRKEARRTNKESARTRNRAGRFVLGFICWLRHHWSCCAQDGQEMDQWNWKNIVTRISFLVLTRVIDGQRPGRHYEGCQMERRRRIPLLPTCTFSAGEGQVRNWVISKQYNAEMLAEAMCKFEGFTYAPSDTEYWIHGHSTERDFIYVTTQTLTREQLQKLSDDVGENRSFWSAAALFGSRTFRNSQT